ncbi:hypothetical protein AYO20_03214 [Fonsecaea nubica]|uniref:Acetyl-CoA synthetase-like protein n=1 Tax=Fonsecaea nubica TaxID=856822 RepID=A0A178D8C2_9EURO|nr:hypothetical protein AYO20_03214 [Fonsecaea nubica]OAL37365.1 hypothetical protein AYO20_03214 [Fonsecaea nubica]
MTIFQSSQPPVKVPNDTPVWTWLFEGEESPLRRFPPEAVNGFSDAATGEHISFKDLKELSTYVSTALVQKYGPRQGECVCLFSPNTIWYPCALFSVLRSGGIVAGPSPAYNVEEMAYALRLSKAKLIFTVPGSLKVAAAAAKTVGITPDRILMLHGEVDGHVSLSQLIDIGRSQGPQRQTAPFTIPRGRQNKDVCAFLSFSSGTTGLPKAVVISHSNIIAQCLQMKQAGAKIDRMIAVLPLFHITGLVHQMHLPIVLNANVHMLPSFSMDLMLKVVQEYRLQELMLVPPILVRLVHDKSIENYDLSSIRYFTSGAAPLSAEIIARLQRLFPNAGLKHGYGMTESGGCITVTTPDKYDFKNATKAGTLLASTEIKVVDPESGAELGPSTPGEIWARGPQITTGYLDNQKATAETFDKDGFLHTGDIGYIDDEGFLTITDRLKELIKVNGIGVAPAELEDLLLGHADVVDAAVIGIPDATSGEKPKAYVVLRSGLTRSPESVARDLIKLAQEKKVRHKWISEVEVIEAIPKAPSGKILRRVLRAQHKAGKRGLVVLREAGPRAKI